MDYNYTWEDEYLDLLSYILDSGEDRADRTGTGTRAIFANFLNLDLTEGFPLVTTKKMPWRSIVSELLWFIEGSGDERRLAEILHGTRDPSKKTIWSANAQATTGSAFQPSYEGDLGRVYGVQWRDWQSVELRGHADYLTHDDNTTTYFDAKVQVTRVDQLKELIERIKTKPTDRRLILSAWNPGELHRMALPPCHMFAQFYVSNNKELSCMMYQRSVDSFLGLPFNIASYALLTHIIAQCTGLKAKQLWMQLGDVHIYKDHFDQVKTQLERKPEAVPTLRINTDNTDIDGFKMDDFVLEGYTPLAAIAAPMSA